MGKIDWTTVANIVLLIGYFALRWFLNRKAEVKPDPIEGSTQKENQIMSGVKDVSQLKDVVVFSVKLANGVQAAMKDGKISFDDGAILIGLIPAAGAAIQGADQIPAEIADFQAEEAVELVNAVAVELVVDNEKAKKIINASLDLIATATPKVAALVEACKS